MAFAAAPTALIVGASRGLGQAMAAELAARGWRVIATMRAHGGDALQALVAAHPGQIEVATVDMTVPADIAALRARLAGRRLDLLFVNAGITSRDEMIAIDAIDTAEFAQVMVTNALSPLRVIEALQDLVPAGGAIGAMSSGQGSIANNRDGLRDTYRASKAALNMLMRGFAVRQADTGRAILLLAPGWIRTDLGGDDAPYTLAETVPLIVDVILAARDTPGLHYLDRFGKTVPW